MKPTHYITIAACCALLINAYSQSVLAIAIAAFLIGVGFMAIVSWVAEVAEANYINSLEKDDEPNGASSGSNSADEQA